MQDYKPVDFAQGKSAWSWEDHTPSTFQAGQKPYDTTARCQLKVSKETEAKLRFVAF